MNIINERAAWLDWLKSLRVGDEVLARTMGSPAIARVTKVTMGQIDFDICTPIKLRRGQVVGYLRDIRPVEAGTRKMIAANKRANEREQMNNDIREVARRLSRVKAERLLAYAKGLR